MPTAKAEWLTEFTIELQRLRAGMDGKIGTSIAMLEWAAKQPDADPVEAAREWAAKRPRERIVSARPESRA